MPRPCVARVVRSTQMGLPVMHQPSDKPSWVDTLEESLLLAIVLFSLITWIMMIGLMRY